jgi:hypothetical protein
MIPSYYLECRQCDIKIIKPECLYRVLAVPNLRFQLQQPVSLHDFKLCSRAVYVWTKVAEVIKEFESVHFFQLELSAEFLRTT